MTDIANHVKTPSVVDILSHGLAGQFVRKNVVVVFRHVEEFISDIIVSNIEVEERKCNTATCPGWGNWRPWTGCSATCWKPGAPKPSQSRYRCWEMAGGRKKCGNKKSQPGNGHLCGRSSSDLCFKEQERYCNTGRDSL